MKDFIKDRFRLKLVTLIAISIFLVSFIIVLWKFNLSLSSYSEIKVSLFSNVVLWFAILYFLIGILVLIFKDRLIKKLNLLLIIGTINTTYLLIELVLIFIPFNPNPYEDKRHFHFNNSCFEYHQERGYIWKDCNCREVLVSSENEMVWDKIVRVNNKGYNSFKDYYKNKLSGIKRYMVLGDSFTSAEFNDSSWVDYTQTTLKKDSIELYSFSLSGIGLQNWHHIYFNEILSNYEFDGIIIGFLSDDWLRKFTIFHTDNFNNIYIGGFDTPPKNRSDFKDNYLNRMVKPQNWTIADDKEIDKDISLSNSKSNRTTLKILELVYYKVIAPVNHNSKTDLNSDFKINSEESIANIYGKNRLKFLTEIIEECKNKNKEIILCNIPLKQEVVDYNKGIYQTHHASLDYLSKHYNITYFNGLNVFSKFKKDKLDSCYYKHDNHWNDIGSKYFAIQFSKTLVKK